jgi:hypothetical protein
MTARLVLLLLFIPTLAFARSGGSFGGGFKSSAPAKSYSAPAKSYSAPVRSYSAPTKVYSAPVRAYSAPTRTWATPSAPRRIYVPSRAPQARESHDGLATLVGIGIGYGLRHAQSQPVSVPVYAPRPVYASHPQYDPNFVGPVLPVESGSNVGWVLLGFFLVTLGVGVAIYFWGRP